MGEPLLSVIMPVYNAAEYIETAVQSVLGQTFASIELICIDDCSKDNSLEILEKAAAKDNRLHIIPLKENGGAGNARNIGIAHAKAEYITFIDADDYIEPELYERAYALTADGTDEVVWGVTEEYYNAKGKHMSSNRIIPAAGSYKGKEQVAKQVTALERDTLFGYQWNSIYKASVIRENNIRFCDSVFYEDYFFNLDFIKHAESLATLDSADYHYFKRVNGSITNRFSKDYFELSYKRVKSMYEFCAAEGCTDETVRKILGKIYARYIYSALQRNCDKRSEMKRHDRKNFLKSIFEDALFAELSPYIEISGYAGILYNSLKNKKTELCLFFGRIIYIVKEKMPTVFATAKQKK